jgi:succinyl-diaminopimelate desuccinylase
MTPKFDATTLTADLIRCPSVTPHEGGALDYVQKQLTSLGFQCWRLPFSASGTPDVDNLFARLGTGAPHLCFAGHTDVVPAGDETLWTHPPFAAHKADGSIYGRGASDMKGAIASFMAAISDQLSKSDIAKRGSISLLITGDEEGPSVNGTEKVLQWMEANNHVPSHCVVGEPTNPEDVGEMIKIGRRGYVNGEIIVRGKAGHVAYAHLAANPIPGLAKIITAFSALVLDKGNAFFDPSNLEFTSIDVGNKADNVIPAAVTAHFNIRFNDTHSRASLQAQLTKLIEVALADTGLTFDFRMSKGGEAFITTPGREIEILESAIQNITGKTPTRSTSGGTSDARFIRKYCPVFEFGLVNKTIHQTNEYAKIADIEKLTAIYSRFIQDYFAKA